MVTEKILNLVSKGNLKMALKMLKDLGGSSPKLMEIINQQGRLSTLEQEILQGLHTSEFSSIERNKIRRAVLAIINEIEEMNEENQDVNQELINFDRTSYIVQNHHGNGDNIAGDYIKGDKIG